MIGHDIVLIGCSAGGAEALTGIFARIPRDAPAALFVVQHVSAGAPSVLPRILGRAGELPAGHARDGEPIRHRHVYVAPPGRGVMVLGRGPRENGHRPAVDPLFQTAAAAHGSRVVAVVLSGGLDDGTAGLIVVKQSRGVAVVQDPDDASTPEMPLSAIRSVEVDHVLPAREIAPLLVRLAGEAAQEDSITMAHATLPWDPALVGTPDLDRRASGPPSVFTCPECGGSLWEINDSGLRRFACHVGHVYSEESTAGNGERQTGTGS
jgi:two-component system chemotaxis response regulator CheB